MIGLRARIRLPYSVRARFLVAAETAPSASAGAAWFAATAADTVAKVVNRKARRETLSTGSADITTLLHLLDTTDLELVLGSADVAMNAMVSFSGIC
mmetsp:Transcript_11697/g.20066  ORF Transcript_11697/g.20066 Transcript_11697/m.20066 type:complete len:97 (-) Transcript_11697:62-352(-)